MRCGLTTLRLARFSLQPSSHAAQLIISLTIAAKSLFVIVADTRAKKARNSLPIHESSRTHWSIHTVAAAVAVFVAEMVHIAV
jgi:hypothetical protein